jgi:hypothetical protein
MRGEGRGVTSAIAFSIGEDNAELGADVMLPILLLRMFLMLGVRAMPIGFEGSLAPGLRPVLIALAAVMV